MRSILSRRFSAAVVAPKVNPPRLFQYEAIKNNLKPSVQIIDAVELAFGKLAMGKVEVPIPMHIGIHESATAGPGDCHIKGGYVEEATTWTVKLGTKEIVYNVLHTKSFFVK